MAVLCFVVRYDFCFRKAIPISIRQPVSTIVAARFQTFEQAESVSLSLREAGFGDDAVNTFFVNPAGQHAVYPLGGDEFADRGTRDAPKGAILVAVIGAVLGAAFGALLFAVFAIPAVLVIGLALVGAYAGSLFGAMQATRSAPRRGAGGGDAAPVGRPAGVLVAVRVNADDRQRAIAVFRGGGGRDIEQAEGEWRDGKWVDFDPIKPPLAAH